MAPNHTGRVMIIIIMATIIMRTESSRMQTASM